jgi:aminoglycoside phosphotransferase family enzyme
MGGRLDKAIGGSGADEPRSQEDVIAFLEAPESYPHPVSEVVRADTHAALIFLAGDRAYKLKRAIKLPYLDFSTVEKRRLVLQRELEINSQTTPELYLAVSPITYDRATGALELGGEGPAVDWVLVMRRFEESTLLDRLALRGEITGDVIPQLASEIEHFHRNAIAIKNGVWLPTLAQIVNDLEDALCGDAARAAGLQLRPYIESLRQELARQTPLLVERENQGFVRRCHGDLHLKNIVLLEGKPRLFDALEFSEELATIDVLYDLAFLLMDFWRRGLKAEANGVFNSYLQKAAIPELRGVALLPLFLSLRAAIRAMTGLHGLPFKDGEARETAFQEIASYGSLAASLLEKQPTQLIAIGGLSGTGKTLAASQIAPFIGAAPGAVHLRTDVERKLMYGVAMDTRLPASAYTPASRDEVYSRICEKAGAVLDAGRSAVIDAVFPEGSSRCLPRGIAKRAHASFAGFWLEAPAGLLRERVSRRAGDASDANAAVLDQQLETVTAPPAWTTIDASGSPEETARSIMKELGAGG